MRVYHLNIGDPDIKTPRVMLNVLRNYGWSFKNCPKQAVSKSNLKSLANIDIILLTMGSVETSNHRFPSIAERIGYEEAAGIAWKATPASPLLARLYSVKVLWSQLEESRTLRDLQDLYSQAYRDSILFRIARARFRIVDPELRKLGIT